MGALACFPQSFSPFPGSQALFLSSHSLLSPPCLFTKFSLISPIFSSCPCVSAGHGYVLPVFFTSAFYPFLLVFFPIFVGLPQ